MMMAFVPLLLVAWIGRDVVRAFGGVHHHRSYHSRGNSLAPPAVFAHHRSSSRQLSRHPAFGTLSSSSSCRRFSQRQEDDNVVSLLDDDNDIGNSSGVQQQQQLERHIPTAGISVSDQLDEVEQHVAFATELVPVKGLPGVAQLTTHSVDPEQQTLEPTRYLVAFQPPQKEGQADDGDQNTPVDDVAATTTASKNTTTASLSLFALVDVPPFSPQLAAELRAFMRGGTLAAILLTSNDALHCDEAPGDVYARPRQRLDVLQQWTQAFPNASIVMSRLDTPRECRDILTQRLDGRGPFAFDDLSGQFEEAGQPLQSHNTQWDPTLAQSVLQGATSPEDAVERMLQQRTKQQQSAANDDNDETAKEQSSYTPNDIRQREQGRPILAVCTPGHSYGSLSYVFPETGVVCSGHTVPVEDTRADEHEGYHAGAGPALDARGYITTAQAGVGRQMASARTLVETYGDRFWAVLPSRGDPMRFDPRLSTAQERQDILLSMIDQYDKIGQIYEQLGITTSSSTSSSGQEEEEEEGRHP